VSRAEEVSTLHQTSSSEKVHYGAGRVFKEPPTGIEEHLMHSFTPVGNSETPPTGGVDGIYIIARETPIV